VSALVAGCSCLTCALRRNGRRIVRKVVVGLLAGVLVLGGLAGSVAVIDRSFSERAIWFDNLLRLAALADREYDTLDVKWSMVEPQTWPDLYQLVKEIVYQIDEEGATTQLIMPTSVGFVDYGPGRRSAVAGTYDPSYGIIVLNERFLTPSWGEQSWFSTLVHELVHAQGYFVGSSATLESQTEIVATEVVAAMANLDYPGARADLLSGLRGDALAVAYYIARFNGGPIHTTNTDNQNLTVSFRGGDSGMMARWQSVRQALLTPTELARSDKRVRWWEERPWEYAEVLGKYAVTTLTMELDASCGTGVMPEPFSQYPLIEGGMQLIWNPKTDAWEMQSGAYWGDAVQLPFLAMDDLRYVLHNELGYC